MNAQTKTTITRDLETLRSHLRRLEKIEADIARCHADAAAMDERRVKLDATSYRNKDATIELSALMRQIEKCNEHRTKQEAALMDAQRELATELDQLYKPAKELLREIVERRSQTIAKIIRPFVSSDKKAVEVAEQTCAYQQGRNVLLMLSGGPWEKAPRKARQLVAIYTEALKADGDLFKFLSPAVVRAAGESHSAEHGRAPLEVSG